VLETAIVGLGNVANWHRRAIERTTGATLTAVADVDESVARDRGRQWGVTPYTDLEELLAAEPLDWVHVCTPLVSHADVAMRCLDEGVDVPNTRQAILMASSNNPKQFIQRRGRVLRKAEGKDRAEIYDMIVVPSLNPTRDMITAEQGILKSELKRFDEFAKTAINQTEARLAIQRIKTIYELEADEETEEEEET